jgi:hypothetical protein
VRQWRLYLGSALSCPLSRIGCVLCAARDVRISRHHHHEIEPATVTISANAAGKAICAHRLKDHRPEHPRCSAAGRAHLGNADQSFPGAGPLDRQEGQGSGLSPLPDQYGRVFRIRMDNPASGTTSQPWTGAWAWAGMKPIRPSAGASTGRSAPPVPENRNEFHATQKNAWKTWRGRTSASGWSSPRGVLVQRMGLLGGGPR